MLFATLDLPCRNLSHAQRPPLLSSFPPSLFPPSPPPPLLPSSSPPPSLDTPRRRSFASGSPSKAAGPGPQTGGFDPGFNGAGARVGVEIWRIEKLKCIKKPNAANAKDTPPNCGQLAHAGALCEGDSYIIMDTKKKGNALERKIYMWIGKDSSQDEYVNSPSPRTFSIVFIYLSFIIINKNRGIDLDRRLPTCRLSSVTSYLCPFMLMCNTFDDSSRP